MQKWNIQYIIMNKYSYKNLDVYQEAKRFVIDVYKLLNDYPDSEKFALCNQIRRAAISVTSNIAEGVSRMSNKEKYTLWKLHMPQ